MDTELFIITVICYVAFLSRRLPVLIPSERKIINYITILLNELGFFLLWASCYIAVVWWKATPLLAVLIVYLGWWGRILIYSMRGMSC